MVETAEIESMIRSCGVDFAQGWLYGQPSVQPERPATLKSAVAPRRRAGAVDSWG
jgi:EAL domain-containing protein (putative c-di-GMP-specific phosphodiesterase class I)